MEFELHVTVETTDIENFKKDCLQLGVKPIVIETQRDSEFGVQVMTSSKHKDDAYDHHEALRYLSLRLANRGYKILRQKVEINPFKEKNKDFIYYESHIRLRLTPEISKVYKEYLKELCWTLRFHLSKNIFKKEEGIELQMMTYRSYTDSYDEFVEVIKLMEFNLNNNGLEYDKVEIEECIYDSNAAIDNNWLKTNSTEM